MTFTLNKYRSYGPKRDAKIERIQNKINNLLSKDELTGKQAARLDRLQNRLDRKTPEDELLVRVVRDTIGFTLIDSTYDDLIEGGDTMRFVIKGSDDDGRRSGQATVLWLNHPEKTNDKYDFGANQTVDIGGITYDFSKYDNYSVEVYANNNLAFAQNI